MILIALTLISALLLSGIAAYYSIIGLAAIFTGAFWPIVFMGSVLEASKLVTASWLYRNWKTCPILLKSYLTGAVVILMIITSMGIFGFLSKAHIDSTLEAGANSVEIRTLTQQEKIAKERLDYLLKRAGNPETASANVDRQIQQTQKELADINKRKLPLLKEENKLIAEVGPIKYIGDMVYGTDDANAIDKAVRLVILLIMVVFDPLAVLLLIAANMSLQQRSKLIEVKDNEIIKIVPEVPTQNTEVANDKIEIPKENITKIEEAPIVIDQATGETIPPLTVHIVPGVYEEHHGIEETKEKANTAEEIVSTKIEKKGFIRPPKDHISKYDEQAELAFKEKANTIKLDGGDF